MNTQNPITANLQAIRDALIEVLNAERQLQKTKESARKIISASLLAYGQACCDANMSPEDVIDMGDGQILTLKHDVKDVLNSAQLDSKPISLQQLCEEFERASNESQP